MQQCQGKSVRYIHTFHKPKQMYGLPLFLRQLNEIVGDRKCVCLHDYQCILPCFSPQIYANIIISANFSSFRRYSTMSKNALIPLPAVTKEGRLITLYPFSYPPTFLTLVITTPTSTDMGVIFVMVHTKYVLPYPPLDFKNYVSHHPIGFASSVFVS